MKKLKHLITEYKFNFNLLKLNILNLKIGIKICKNKLKI